MMQLKDWLILFKPLPISKFICRGSAISNYSRNNITVHSAVERELMVIGEAVNRLLKAFPDIGITDAKKIVGLRNKMIHEYDIVDDVQLWNIIINHLPKLKQDAERLLKKEK